MCPLIESKEISFYYPQDGHGLDPISLEINAGQVVLVTGPSGCGKSTLARCLTGLIPHLYRGQFKGQVFINGISTADTPLWRLAELVGMVFQNPASQMLAATVEDEILFGLENLGLPHSEADQRLEDALQRFNLAQMRLRSPHTLSGGEQQKLALAAITARRPAALVLDEPLSMLDTTSALEFIRHTQDLVSEGASVVYCEHRQEYLHDLGNLTLLSLGETVPQAAASPPISAWPLPHQKFFSVKVEGLKVARGGRTVLHDLNLVLPAGKTIALVGRNGVGKTTLFRALAGLQKYTGSIRVQTETAEEQAQLGMVFQNPDLQLFNASVREEILYRLEQPNAVLYQWLVQVLDLTRYENTPPLLMSEGEKRRVALATILMHLPKHGLLLDEPALGQDDFHKEVLLRPLHAYARAGFLVVFSTHDLELAAQADHLIVLGPEGIAAQGDAADVTQLDSVWQNQGIVLPDWVKVKWCV